MKTTILLSLGAALAWHPVSARGAVSPQVVEKIEAAIAAKIREEHAKTGVAHRDAHPKHHGCVRATFKVTETLPADLKVGVFQPGKQYPAWLRFSNGREFDDTKGDGRGLAIKLIGVPGEKILAEEKTEQTQDFLLINHNAFFVKNGADYVDFVTAKNPLTGFFLWPLHPHLQEFRVAMAIRRKKVANPLTTDYHSMTPYSFGGRAVRYRAYPCGGVEVAKRLPKDPNYLRAAMKGTLDAKSACFDFAVQFQPADSRRFPVENPVLAWPESLSPFRKVATLTIDRQAFVSDKQQEFCENLSYTPWHSLPEHRPLGEINEVRKVVYQTISKLRHDLNKEKRIEPTGKETF